MSLFRNTEIKKFILGLSAASLVIAGLALFLSPFSALLVLLVSFLLIISFLLFTLSRYRSIKELSTNIREIASGNYSLDLDRHIEGELSILKSEISKVTRMLADQNDQLQKDRLLLSMHLAEISHQIKTPLTSVMLMLELLERDDLPSDKRVDFASQINRQIKRIEWLVSSLLKISRLDAGVVSFAAKPVSLNTLIQESLQPFLISLELKGITHHIEIKGDTILCDKEWTREALINIIKNCMEHTPQGGHLSICTRNNPVFTEIIIEDNGQGIPKEELTHIFTRFYRGSNASADSVGIGLSLSHKIISSQQGEISVTSTLGKGTCFQIRLFKSIL